MMAQEGQAKSCASFLHQQWGEERVAVVPLII